MSYPTTYELEIRGDEPTIVAVAAMVAELNGNTPSAPSESMINFWVRALQNTGDTQWYDHDTHMRQVSTKWPNVVFVLYGNSEKSDDHWVAYYWSGMGVKHKQPEWVPPPFDLDDLSWG